MKILLPVVVLLGTFFFGKYLLSTGPEAKKKPFVQRFPVVEVITIEPQSYTVNLKASGVVRAGIQTNLISEVSGRIIKISGNFNEGSYFNKQQTLMEIDSANYDNALAISKSDVAGNRATLKQLNVEEKTTHRSIQLAKKNLQLGKSELLRKRKLWNKKLIARSTLDLEEQKQNQLEQRLAESVGKLNTYKSRKLAIESKINAALIRQKQERLNLSRTTIRTPYAGRVLQKNVDIGQFVSKGAKLGKIYATDYVYVDLPLSLNQFELLDIPEKFQNKESTLSFPEVVFNNTNSRQKSSWVGRVVRTSAALDAASRQIKVIARIDQPFTAKVGVSAPIKIGQYLNAEIKGKTFRNIYVLAAGSVRQNKEILLLKDGKIHIVAVDVLVNTSEKTIVRAQEDINKAQLIITSMNQATEGMQVVSLKDQKMRQKEKQKKNAIKKTKEKDAG